MTQTDTYEIRVLGHLDARWSAWFDGMALTLEEGGITVIRGVVADQSALHGLIQKVRDLGLPLISVTSPATSRVTSPGTETRGPRS